MLPVRLRSPAFHFRVGWNLEDAVLDAPAFALAFDAGFVLKQDAHGAFHAGRLFDVGRGEPLTAVFLEQRDDGVALACRVARGLAWGRELLQIMTAR